MDDLLFTRADRPSVRLTRLLSTMAPLAVICVLLLMAGHWLAAGVVVAGVAALIVVLRLLFRGAWMKVDAAGISYSLLGVSRTRHLAWHEVGGIQIRESRSQNGSTRIVKVVLRDGKPRTLPVLTDSNVTPDPDFDRKVAAIRDLSTHYGSVPQSGPAAVPLTVEASWSRRDGKFRRWSWRYIVPVIAFGMLTFGSMDGVPAWSAHLGGGKHGIFTATQVNCGRSCFWTGNFTSEDGTDTRYGVGLGSGGNIHQVGARIPAVDTGDRVDVYPSGGGDDWIYLTAITLGALVLLALWFRSVPLRSMRARRSAAPDVSSLGTQRGI